MRSNGIVEEKAHLKTNKKKFDENYDRIFGKQSRKENFISDEDFRELTLNFFIINKEIHNHYCDFVDTHSLMSIEEQDFSLWAVKYFNLNIKHKQQLFKYADSFGYDLEGYFNEQAKIN